ncbi:MAG: DUF1559 domain-containing protein [Planctomycetaceae bacterium]
MKTPCSIRRGFTVVELATVMATASVLLSVMVPAMQDLQDAGRRRECQNNLKRIGLALHNYHDVYSVFPPGWVLAYRDASSHSGYGWQAAILPYVDQATVFNRLTPSLPPGPPDDISSLALSAYQCPSSSADDLNAFRGGYGTSNYTGNYGSEPIPRWTTGRMESWWPGGVEAADRRLPAPLLFGAPERDPPAQQGSRRQRRGRGGIFRWNSNVKIRDVTDGTSNSIAIGERSVISGSGIWIGVQSNRSENDAVTDASFWSPINASLTGYSSEHGNGVQVGLVDGSVRFLDAGVASLPTRGVLQNLADISDGEIVPPDALGK